MTRIAEALTALSPLVADLAHDLPAELRHRRLLAALCGLFPCDTAALLRLDGPCLVPLSVHGLRPDTLGRRFAVADHPRLQALLDAPRAMRFPPDGDLPSPYDGLVEGGADARQVQDGMGCALRIGPDAWGLITLDARQADRFSSGDLELLDTFAGLAAATVTAAARTGPSPRSIEQGCRKAEAEPARPVRMGLGAQGATYRQLVSDIGTAASNDLSVLITGETGVSKALVARQIHAGSSRADKPLVSIDCSALPGTRVEGERVAVRGTFSGAAGDWPGRFEMAHGSTLFLDKLGELPLAAQDELLHALQDDPLQHREPDPEHRVSVRLIAATHRDLAQEVQAGRFRADLHCRLSAFSLRVPGLRQRGGDAPVPAGAFIDENSRRRGLRGLQTAARAPFTPRHVPIAAADAGGHAARPDPGGTGRPGFAPGPCPLLPSGFVDDFFHPENQAAALASLTTACNGLVADMTMPAIDTTSVVHRDKSYYFAHFANDYIPSKIRDSGKFYEAPFLNLLARLHQPGKIIVDGGANLGNHSVFFAGVMKAQVVAFEPQPHNHFLLHANRSLNRLDGSIDVRPKALGAQIGTVSLHLALENNYGTFTSLDRAAPESQTGNGAMPALPEFSVEVTTLDGELAAEIDRISILKLDVEGMELEALQGARHILRHGKPLVSVECLNKSRYQAIKDFLTNFDYFLVDSVNATPTFVFINKSNPFHIEALAAHLERVSFVKVNTNESFNAS